MTEGDSPHLPQNLILASRSPRRRELLKEQGFEFDVSPPDILEPPPRPGESAEVYALRLAFEKAANVAGRFSAGLVLACDTVVECDGEIFGTPTDREDAERILRALRGRIHRVITAVCLWDVSTGRAQLRAATTVLRMHPLTDEQLRDYLDSNKWQGKAGAFGYQDRLGWVEIVEGSASNVVGLPLELLREMLPFFCETPPSPAS